MRKKVKRVAQICSLKMQIDNSRFWTSFSSTI